MLHWPEPTKERVKPTTIGIPAIEILHLTRFTQTRRQDFAAGGAKSHKGGTFLKYSIAYMQQTGDKAWNGWAQISNGGPVTTTLQWRRPWVHSAVTDTNSMFNVA